MTSIEKLISGIEEELEAAWQLPMSGGKVLVDTKNIMKMINDVKENLPMEIVQAKKIVQDRSEIIDRARAEAETIMKTSEEKVKQLINSNLNAFLTLSYLCHYSVNLYFLFGDFSLSSVVSILPS